MPLPFPTRALLRRTALLLLAATWPAVSASAATLYAIGGNSGPGGGQSALYTLDAGTGSMTWVGGLHTAGSSDNSLYSGGLAYDPYTDRMYALGCDSSTTSALFLVDRTDASMIRLGSCYPPNSGAFCSGGLTFDVTTGRLFAIGDLGLPPFQRTSLVELDPSTGAATLVGLNGAAGTYLSGLGCDPQTGILYANGFRNFDGQSALFSLDKGSGAPTFLGSHGLPLGRQMNYSGLAFHPTTGVMYGFGSFSASLNYLYRVDKSAGTATPVGPESPNGVGVDGALVYVGTDVLDASASERGLLPLRVWPNPARAGAVFGFGLPRPGDVSLTLFDLAGRRMATLTAAGLAAGPHVLRWDGSDRRGERVPAGLYFATLRVDGAVIGRTSVMVAR